MKPLQVGLLVVAGGLGGALVLELQSPRHPAHADVVVATTVIIMMPPAASAPVTALSPFVPPASQPQRSAKAESPSRPPRLTPLRRPIRGYQNISQPFAKPSSLFGFLLS
jgi:hypothetical protein